MICGAHVSFLGIGPPLEVLNRYGPLSPGQSIIILFRSESSAISQISLALMRRNVLSDQSRESPLSTVLMSGYSINLPELHIVFHLHCLFGLLNELVLLFTSPRPTSLMMPGVDQLAHF